MSVVCCHVGISAKADHSSRGVLPTLVRRCVWSIKLKTEQSVASAGQQSPKKGRIMNENLPPVPCVEPDHTQRKTAILKLHILWTHPVLHHKYLHCSFFFECGRCEQGAGGHFQRPGVDPASTLCTCSDWSAALDKLSSLNLTI